MSDELKPTDKETKAPAAAEKPATPAAPAAKTPEPPPPPEPGVFGKILDAKNFGVKHLGPDAGGTEMIDIPAARLLEVAAFLRDDAQCRFDLLVSVTGVDWKNRLEAVYHLYSTETHQKLALKATAENEHLPSVTPVWPAADWHERETFDLLGIIFDGHPNLKRIMMPSDWLGHPLRKDYVENDPRLVWNQR